MKSLKWHQTVSDETKLYFINYCRLVVLITSYTTTVFTLKSSAETTRTDSML